MKIDVLYDTPPNTGSKLKGKIGPKKIKRENKKVRGKIEKRKRREEEDGRKRKRARESGWFPLISGLCNFEREPVLKTSFKQSLVHG